MHVKVVACELFSFCCRNSLDSLSVNDEIISIQKQFIYLTTKQHVSELLSSAEITPIFKESPIRSNFAASLEQRLFDMSARIRSE